MAGLDVAAFAVNYRRAVEEIRPFLTPESLAVIARHNLGLHPERLDLVAYLRASEKRYVLALERFNAHHTRGQEPVSALDVGGFLGAFPLALARIGVDVTLVEEYDYYHGAFDDLKAFLESQGITIWATDFTQPLFEPPPRRYDLVTNMAMLEHLANSPKALMDNLHSSLSDRGLLVVDVPNIGYWPTRLRALRGESIHQGYDLYYASEPPFLGHHREYTPAELRDLLDWTDYDLQSLDLQNYSLDWRAGGWRDRLYTFVVYLWPTLVWASCREVITATATARRPRAATLRPDALRLLSSGPAGE
jgi:SAM-dependent methyltransferase